MKYVFGDKIFDTLEQAQDFAAPIIAKFLVDEAYRFSLVKGVVTGSDMTWVAANLDTDPEDAIYFVFNPINGLHERVESKSAAVSKMQELKNAFVVFSGLVVEEISDEEALSRLKSLLASEKLLNEIGVSVSKTNP